VSANSMKMSTFEFAGTH